MQKYSLLILFVVVLCLAAAVVFVASRGEEEGINFSEQPVPTQSVQVKSVQQTATVKEAIITLFTEQYHWPAGTFTVEVLTDTGLFAKGTVNSTDNPRGGGVWFAAKTEKGWELASSGNGIVPCSTIEPYNFPKDMIPQCIDVRNGNALIQR